jgi:aminoglycoside 6-adenylyltransferase
MNKHKHKEAIIDKLRQWAGRNKDITYVIITGSRGRQTMGADEYSDIDVTIFSRNVKCYEKTTDWVTQIAPPVACYQDTIATGLTGKKIFFPGEVAMDVFFVDSRLLSWLYHYVQLKDRKILFAAIPSSLKKIIDNRIFFFMDYISRGFYCVVDKRDYHQKLMYIEQKCRCQPETYFNLQRVEHIVNKFWHHAYFMAVKLHRGNYFSAKIQYDNGMKYNLLYLMEMQAKTVKGKNFETWYSGRYVEEWGDPYVVSRLPYIFGHYEPTDAWNSLMETMSLFTYLTNFIIRNHPEHTFLNPAEEVTAWINALREKQVTAGILQDYKISRTLN